MYACILSSKFSVQEQKPYRLIVNLETDYLSYGCWGQLLSNIAPVGKPLDVLDEHFQNYHKCKQCVAFDSPSCNLTQVSYNVELDGGDSDWRLSCESESNSECQVQQCKCDEELSFNIQALYDQFKDELKFANGFDHDANCPKVGNVCADKLILNNEL